MAFYIGRRILQSIPLLLLITLLSFGLMNLVPYDAVDSISNSKMTEAQREEKREEYGLNDPMPVQYFRWLKNILRGEFGNSLLSHTRIKDDLRIRIPNTILLVLPSYLTAYFLAMAVGLYSASQKGKWQDKLLDSFSTIGLAVPSFWIALVLIYFFWLSLEAFSLAGDAYHWEGKGYSGLSSSSFSSLLCIGACFFSGFNALCSFFRIVGIKAGLCSGAKSFWRK